VRVACRYHLGIIESVLWLEVEPYLTGRNAVAIRLRKLRAGRLPLPMQTVLEMIDQSVRNADLRIEWSQLGGDPVASISLPPQRDPAGNEFTLDTLRISEGKLIVAGTSKKK